PSGCRSRTPSSGRAGCRIRRYLSAWSWHRSQVDDFAGRLGETHLAAVAQRLEPDPGRLAGLGVEMGHVGDVDRRLLLLDAAGGALGRPVVALDHVDALHDHPVLRRQDLQDLALLALVAAGGD